MNKRTVIAICSILVCALVGIIALLYAHDKQAHSSGMAARELLQLSGIEASNVESIRFIKNRETQEVWLTSDPHIIEDILDHFGEITLEETGGGAGFYLWLRLNLTNTVNDQEYVDITLFSPTWYMGKLLPDGTIPGYEVTSGAKSAEEWEAILDACERIT